VEGHGGAIYHIEDDYSGGNGEDNIEIRGSTFSNNYAHRQGGGAWILVHGLGRIVNSTFSENGAAMAGSNVVGQGGALIVSKGLLDIVNSTFAWNSATFQGGAIHTGGSGDAERVVTLANTLFYENRLDPTHTNPVTTEWQGYHTNRPLQDGGHNLQYPRDKAPHWNNTVNNFIVLPESAILFADAELQDLGQHGGPTAVRPLPATSPAIDAAGEVNCPAIDQRGVYRDQGPGCDIGAYERVFSLRVSPTLLDRGQAAALTVRGSDFEPGDIVLWQGQMLPTTYVDSLTLHAGVDGAQTTAIGEVQVTVSGSPLSPATVTVVDALQRILLPFLRSW
jgi:predicted outer membrane repeat protein